MSPSYIYQQRNGERSSLSPASQCRTSKRYGALCFASEHQSPTSPFHIILSIIDMPSHSIEKTNLNGLDSGDSSPDSSIIESARQVKFVRFSDQPHLIDTNLHCPITHNDRIPTMPGSCPHSESYEYCYSTTDSSSDDSAQAQTIRYSSSETLVDEEEQQPLLMRNRLCPEIRIMPEEEDTSMKVAVIALLGLFAIILFLQFVLLLDSARKRLMWF